MEEKISVTSAGGVELDYEIAGLGGRSFAYIIDWHIKTLLGLTWFFITVYLVFTTFDFENILDTVEEDKSAFWLWWFLIVIPSTVINFFYHPILELVMKGRTPGKRMAGVRVIGKNGYTATGGAIVVRNVFRIIDSFPGGLYCLGMLVALFNRNNLRVGDIAAGTVLVYEEKVSDKGINAIIKNEEQGGTTRDRELATELFERWKVLDQGVRIDLASKLLQRLGQPAPEAKRTSKRDKMLYQQLKQIIKVS